MSSHRATTYWIVGLGLAAGGILLRSADYVSDAETHSVLEAIATVLAMVVGVLALARHYSKRDATFLIVGAAFFGTAFLDGYHAIVTTGTISALLPSDLPSLIPWSWVASRALLSFLLFLSWYLWHLENRRGANLYLSDRALYVIVGCMTLAAFLFFAFVPLPQAYFPELLTPRPEEFLPAAFFLIALIGYLGKGRWRVDSFEHWIILSLITCTISQAVYMSSSRELFDASFDAAHVLKIVGYIFALIGLVTSMSSIFRDASDTTFTLAQANISLKIEADERRRAEEELRVAKEEAEKANNAKSDFLSSMSHELRTPLNSILGFSQLISTDPDLPLDKEQQDSIDQISRAGNHLLDLINEVLDLSKIETGAMTMSIEGVVIGSTFDEVISLTETHAATRNINVSIDYENVRYQILRADHTRLRQVLLNLLSNAVKYNVEDGSVHLSCTATDEGLFRVSVRDSGPGLTSAQLGDIFEPFNRLGAERTEIEGTGIGLTITKRLIEMMGGQMGVDSEVGAGTTFWFELPRGEAPTDVIEVVAEKSDEPLAVHHEGAPRKVLYVEDNPSNLRLMERIIDRRPDLELLSAHNAEFGLELARTRAPDIILMDINLPGMNGFDALDLLRRDKRTKEIPVLAVTANATTRDIQHGEIAGFGAYITKPLNITDVLQAIDQTLDEKA